MRKLVRGLVWFAVVVGLIVGALRMTVLEWWQVPMDDPQMGASVAPTLAPGDWVLVLHHAPSFGDLARCIDPQEPRRFVIGRLLGEQGDRLTFDGPDVSVNDKRGVQEHSCSPSKVTVNDPTSGTPVDLHCSVEAVINHKHLRATSTRGHTGPTNRTATVSEGNVYLVSDNRVFPLDSREYGAIPKASCNDLIFFRVVSLKGFGDADTRLTYLR